MNEDHLKGFVISASITAAALSIYYLISTRRREEQERAILKKAKQMALKYQKHLAAQEDEAITNQNSVKQSQVSTRASHQRTQSPTQKS